MTPRLASTAVVLLLLAVPLAGTILNEPWLITLATRVAILGLAGVGLNLVLGYGGMVSLGHAAYFGIGGYVAGILAHHALEGHPLMAWPVALGGTDSMILIWLVAIVCGALLALLIGSLSLRTTGVYFIMITLAFAQMIYYFTISWPAYGGEDGLPIYLRNSLFGLDTMDPMTFFLIVFAALVVVILLVSRVVQSNFGLALNAVRQNEARVRSVGIGGFRIRLVAFVMSGAITALAGALFVDLNRFVSPSMLSWHTSGEIMIFVILGGVARLWGPIAGAALYVFLEQVLGSMTEHWQFWVGLLLIAVVLHARGGIMGFISGRRADGD